MDNIIFEDPSKPPIRPKQHARAVPTKVVRSSGGKCIQEVEPHAMTPLPEIRLTDHLHTNNEGHSGKPARY